MKIRDAQKVVKKFALQQEWDDHPCVDKFDHIHEELTEISHMLRYKNREERLQTIIDNKEKIQGEIGDIIFGLLRLSNQLQVDAQEGFEETTEKVKNKFKGICENNSSDLKREEK